MNTDWHDLKKVIIYIVALIGIMMLSANIIGKFDEISTDIEEFLIDNNFITSSKVENDLGVRYLEYIKSKYGPVSWPKHFAGVWATHCTWIGDPPKDYFAIRFQPDGFAVYRFSKGPSRYGFAWTKEARLNSKFLLFTPALYDAMRVTSPDFIRKSFPVTVRPVDQNRGIMVEVEYEYAGEAITGRYKSRPIAVSLSEDGEFTTRYGGFTPDEPPWRDISLTQCPDDQ